MNIEGRAVSLFLHGCLLKLSDLGEYLKDAREKFVKDSVFMQNRDQFEDYMRVMEN